MDCNCTQWFLLMCLGCIGPVLCAQPSTSAAITSLPHSTRQSPQQARTYLQLAQEQISLQHPAAARTLLDRAIALQHDLSEAYLLRATLKKAEDDLVGAIVDYSVVIHLQPEHHEARFQRALTRYEAERYASAQEDFEHLLASEGGETNTVYFKGSDEGNTFVASSATTVQSDMQADLLNYLGLCHWHTQHFVEAKEYFSQAIAYAPREPAAYANLALTHEAMGDTLQAIRFYQQTLEIVPNHPVALRNLSSLARQLDDATLEAEILLDRELSTYDAWLQRGMLHHRQKAYTQAIYSFTQALELSPGSAEVLIQRGFSYEKVPALQEALQDYSRAIRLNPRATKAYSNRGNVHFRLKKYAAALEDYNHALDLDSENATALYNRGLAQHQLGNQAAACEDLQRAAALGNPNAARPLAKICSTP